MIGESNTIKYDDSNPGTIANERLSKSVPIGLKLYSM